MTERPVPRRPGRPRVPLPDPPLARVARERLGLPVPEMAALVGCPVKTWADWERRDRVPTVPTARLLHAMLDVPELVAWLRAVPAAATEARKGEKRSPGPKKELD